MFVDDTTADAANIDANYDARLAQEKDKDALIANIQSILNKPNSIESENELITLVQQQRRLMLDIATATFIKKPNNPKLLDSINTILSQIEKTVRDDRKEKLKNRELEDNKANFASFVNALNEVANGKITLPTYSGINIAADWDKPLIDLSDPDLAISDEELYMGRQDVDPKKIAESFDIDEHVEPKLGSVGDPDEDEGDFDPES